MHCTFAIVDFSVIFDTFYNICSFSKFIHGFFRLLPFKPHNAPARLPCRIFRSLLFISFVLRIFASSRIKLFIFFERDFLYATKSVLALKSISFGLA